MPNVPLAGYRHAIANKIHAILDHSGPASYATGGEALNATDLSMSGIDKVTVSDFSMSGTYEVRVLYPVNGLLCVQLVHLAWYVQATELQVTPGTNLAAEHIRLEVWGV